MDKPHIITEDDLALVSNNALNREQLQFLLRRTPEKYIKERPAKGGGTWRYVPGGYIRKVLNLMFGWQWNFEILENAIIQDEVVVRGKLTVTSNGIVIVKMQYGNKEIAFKTETYTDENGIKKKRPTDKYLSIGNDFKAAATDALKKCAADLGIASDVYYEDEFNEVTIIDPPQAEELQTLFDLKKHALSPNVIEMAERIIHNKEQKSYSKLFKILSAL